jgi:hypothetical protein
LRVIISHAAPGTGASYPPTRSRKSLARCPTVSFSASTTTSS